VVVLLLIIIVVTVLLQPTTPTDKVRDVFIIFMALESLIIGAAMVVLMVQIATLINLLNNEIKPMLEATNETISTLRGTTQFLSENLVEPVVKLNSYVAGLQKMVDIFKLKK
jgi:amino acid permease